LGLEVRRILFDVNGIVLIVTIVGLIILFSYLNPHFFSLLNFRIILETMSILAIVALGVHFLLVAGEIDVSFISVMELAAVVAAVSSPANTFYLILVGLLAAIAVGIVNGFFTVKVRIPSFLVTLATMIGVQGLVYVLTNYRAVLIRDDLLPKIFYGARFVGDVSVAVFWMIGLIITAGIIARYTRFGRWMYSTGGDERAARLMGVPTARVKFMLFVVSSVMAGIAGFILASRALAARPLMAKAYLMPGIAAPILGGALLTGGRGSVVRTALGCLLLTIITNGVYILGLDPAYHQIFMGVVLVVALSIRSLQLEGREIQFRRIMKFIKR